MPMYSVKKRIIPKSQAIRHGVAGGGKNMDPTKTPSKHKKVFPNENRGDKNSILWILENLLWLFGSEAGSPISGHRIIGYPTSMSTGNKKFLIFQGRKDEKFSFPSSPCDKYIQYVVYFLELLARIQWNGICIRTNGLRQIVYYARTRRGPSAAWSDSAHV